jgi:hypothetical protein
MNDEPAAIPWRPARRFPAFRLFAAGSSLPARRLSGSLLSWA